MPTPKLSASALLYIATFVAFATVSQVDAEVTCDPVPLTEIDGCEVAGKSRVSLHDDPDPLAGAKDNLNWSWLKGPAMAGDSLGNPALNGGTEYALCIYDGNDGVHELRRDLQIPASGVLWRVKSQNGFQYTDRDLANDGVLSLRVKVDPDKPGRSQVKLKARGLNFAPPGPPLDEPLFYFEQEPSVILNLVNSEGTCWTVEYTPPHNRKITAKNYKAVVD
jgi:hypothetical protein